MSSPDPASAPPRKRKGSKTSLTILLLVAAILGIASGGLAVYLNNGDPANTQTAHACSLSDDRMAALDAAAQGEVAAFAVVDEGRPAPELAFRDIEGNQRSLTDWRGQTVLFNLWATWCAPCREEMPALDALQASFGGDDFEVVAVNIDTRDSANPQGFLSEINVASLAFYQDATADTFQDLRAEGLAFGMPTTLLIDQDGCLQGFLAGAAHWDSDDALALVAAAQVP